MRLVLAMATDHHPPGRNPERIPELMAELQARWQGNPDLRLMQLLVGLINPKDPCPELFYLEDDALLELPRFKE